MSTDVITRLETQNQNVLNQTSNESSEVDAPIKTVELSELNIKAWDEFVLLHEQSTFFHLAGWKSVIEKAFGHKCYFYCAERNGVIEGVLPLSHIQSMLFGNSLMSTPFCVYGGIIANTTDAYETLKKKAIELATTLNVDHLELKVFDLINSESQNNDSHYDDWHEKDLYVTFRKTIDPDPEVNLKAIPRKQRAMVRKGIKAGLVSHIDNNMDRFYDIYATSVRNHGTPVFSKKYFDLLKEQFGEQCEILTVTKDEKPISSVVSFYFKNEVLPYYGGGMLDARRYKGFDFMYWELMKKACQQGIQIFDYGRSKKGTGSYSFKKNWGFEPTPLSYKYYLVKSKQVPDVNPLNPKYQLFIKMWKRMPVSLSKIVGPWLSKNLG